MRREPGVACLTRELGVPDRVVDVGLSHIARGV